LGAYWFRLSAENFSCNPRKSGWPRKNLDKQINATDNTEALLAEATHIINNFEDYLAEEELYDLAA